MISHFLCRVMALSPVFSITRDNSYGFNKEGWKQGLRFSVINLILGHTTYYFFTFRRNNEKIVFNIKEKISLSECQWHQDQESENESVKDKDEKILRLSEEYINSQQNISKDDVLIQKEFLLYLQKNNLSRKNLSYEKMSYYTTIVLVFLPIIPSFFKSTFSMVVNNTPQLSILYWVLFGILMYMIMNWGLLAIQYMSVCGIRKSSFKEIKDPPRGRSTNDQLLYSYYSDWQEERFDTNLRVAYVSNTEVFVKAAVLMIVALIVLSFTAEKICQSPQVKVANEVAYVQTINATNLEDPFSADSIVLSELCTQIQKGRPSDILILANPNLKAERLINQYLLPFRDYINIIVCTDMALDVHTFKITILD